ncbi:flavin monoamine oxidase family protein [Heyndrickxia sporothermodurans]
MSHYIPPKITPDQQIEAIQNGISKTHTPKKIIIVGAGMAGLVAGSLLMEAGHHISIIEANHRVGGRIYTIRSPFSRGLYLDAGAMRIPDIHHLTLEYIKKFKLPVNEFINRTSMDIIYVNGRKVRLHEYERNPAILNFPVSMNEKGKSSEELLLLAVQPIIDFINLNPKKHWYYVQKEFNKYSLGSFLNHYHYKYGTTFSSGAVDMIGVLLDLEAFMGMSFLEALRELIIFQATKKYYEITGGNDLLPCAFLPQLKDQIFFNQRVEKIVQDRNGVTIYAQDQNTFKHTAFSGDLAIVTIPFSLLRFVKIEPYHSFSYYKHKAIRELNYMASTKIGLQFKSRFWEKAGLYGGKTITDLPIRFSYYPSNGIGSPGPAVVLASYTWADEALTWEGYSNDERMKYALKNMEEILGNQVYHQFQTGISYSWTENPYSCGAFTFFESEQETELFPYMLKPEGRVHFAGEHTASNHGWVQGAIESGIRVAMEVNHLLPANKK